MADSVRAPKQWSLTKVETITSFENWRQNLVYSLNGQFAPFLQEETTWQKKTERIITIEVAGFANTS